MIIDFLLRVYDGLVGLLLRLRIHYLNVATFGAWKYLGQQVILTQDVLSRTEYRLDEWMRFYEQISGESIPSHIEPPRQTVYGEGVPMEEEAEMVARALLDYQAEQAKLAAEKELADAPPPIQG